MTASIWRGLAVVLAMGTVASPARALDEDSPPQPSDSTQEARHEYQAGMDAYQAKRFVEAALHFEAAVAQRPHAVALYTAALAWDQANMPERAADDFARALDVPGLIAPQAQNARERLATLERALGRLDVNAPEGWRVQLDANTAVPAPAHLHAMPGVHALAIEAQGLPIQHRDVTLELGRTAHLDLAAPAPAAPAPRKPEPAAPREAPPVQPVRARWAPSQARREVGFGLIGAGAASLVAGVVLGESALSARDAYNAAPSRAAYDHASSLEAWTDVVFVAGAVFVVGGAALALWPAPDSSARREPALSITPSLGGAVVRGVF